MVLNFKFSFYFISYVEFGSAPFVLFTSESARAKYK